MAQKGPKWPKNDSIWPKITPNCLKITFSLLECMLQACRGTLDQKVHDVLSCLNSASRELNKISLFCFNWRCFLKSYQQGIFLIKSQSCEVFVTSCVGQCDLGLVEIQHSSCVPCKNKRYMGVIFSLLLKVNDQVRLSNVGGRIRCDFTLLSTTTVLPDMTFIF